MALPYLMMGNIAEAGTYLRKGAGHYAGQRIDLLRDRVSGVDVAARNVKLGSGGRLAYDRLLIATGSHPVKPEIPGVERAGVHPCWTMEDARRIIARAAPGARVLQVGAGFIGCIIMEALVSRGVRLTVVEMGDRMVPRMMTPAAGAMIRAWCEGKGVRVHVASRVHAIRRGDKEGVLIANLDSGDDIEADLIIIAAGVRPNIRFLNDSAIACATGVLVDATMQSSAPGVYAAGDVAEALDFSTGARSINAIQPSAVEQARVAASNMAGRRVESRGNLALNVLDTLGLISSSFGKWWGAPGGESVELVDERAYRYLSLQFDKDVLVGATAIGLTQHVGVLRGLIEGKVALGPWKARLLADPLAVMDAYLARAQAAA